MKFIYLLFFFFGLENDKMLPLLIFIMCLAKFLSGSILSIKNLTWTIQKKKMLKVLNFFF